MTFRRRRELRSRRQQRRVAKHIPKMRRNNCGGEERVVAKKNRCGGEGEKCDYVKKEKNF